MARGDAQPEHLVYFALGFCEGECGRRVRGAGIRRRKRDAYRGVGGQSTQGIGRRVTDLW